MKEFAIPISSMSKMMNISRKTLSDILNNKRKITQRSQSKINDFYNSWRFDKELNCFVQGFVDDIQNYKISKTGYAYPKPKRIIKNEFKKPARKHNHLVDYVSKIDKATALAMKFHKEKPIFPKYDTWFMCNRCDMRIKGYLRKRNTYKCKCGEKLRPCLNCVHYNKCDFSECNYRKRTTGTQCKNCKEFVSDRTNELQECTCGRLNTFKDAESIDKVNREAGF